MTVVTFAEHKGWKGAAGSVLGFCLIFLLPLLHGGSARSAELTPDLRQAIPNQLENQERNRNILLEKARKAIESGVSSRVVIAVVEHSLDRGLDGHAVGRLLDEIVSAHEKGLPTDPLAGKVLEGLAKHVNSQGIEAALAKVAQRMETAGQTIAKAGLGTLSEEEYDRLIMESSDAMSAGLEPDQLEDILGMMAGNLENSDEVRPPDIMEMTTILIGYGLDFDPVRRVVRGAVENKHLSSEDLRSFIINFVKERRKGREAADPESTWMDQFGEELPESAGSGLETAEEASEGRSSEGETAEEASDGRGSGEDTAEEASDGRSSGQGHPE